jgi:hypothetical protein
MASKLFRAVVGFGIGLGAASAACFGSTEGSTAGTTAETLPDGSTSSTVPSPSGTGTTTPDVDPPDTTKDATVDAKVTDAGVDAPKDVGVDAFCDAAWPTTKGNPGPPKCTDPNGECADAGFPNYCVGQDDAGACDFAWNKTTAPFCVNKEWRCQPGTTSIDQCQ